MVPDRVLRFQDDDDKSTTEEDKEAIAALGDEEKMETMMYGFATAEELDQWMKIMVKVGMWY